MILRRRLGADLRLHLHELAARRLIGPVRSSASDSNLKLNGPKRTTSLGASFCRLTCTSLTKVPLALLRS